MIIQMNHKFITWFLITISLLLSGIFFYWAVYAIYDSKELESRGHYEYAKKHYKKSYEYFFRAAEITENAMISHPDLETQDLIKQKLSSRYRFAASAAHASKEYKKSWSMLKKSLFYNPDNSQAIALQKHMNVNKQGK
jgi:tetratricopeptide (TPR) repeat protein